MGEIRFRKNEVLMYKLDICAVCWNGETWKDQAGETDRANRFCGDETKEMRFAPVIN